MVFILGCLAFSLLGCLAAASYDPNNHFDFPGIPGNAGDYSQNLVITLGTAQQFLWTSTTPTVNVALWQDLGTVETLATNLTAQSFDWGGYPAQSLSKGIVFFVALYNSSNPLQELFASHYFNVTNPNAATTSATVSATSSVASTAAATTTSTTTTSAASSSTTSAISSSSTRSSTNVAVGVGVGVGLAAVLAVVGGGIWLIRSRKRKHSNASNPLLNEDHRFRDAHELGPKEPYAQTYSQDYQQKEPFPQQVLPQAELPAHYNRQTEASELSA